MHSQNNRQLNAPKLHSSEKILINGRAPPITRPFFTARYPVPKTGQLYTPRTNNFLAGPRIYTFNQMRPNGCPRELCRFHAALAGPDIHAPKSRKLHLRSSFALQVSAAFNSAAGGKLNCSPADYLWIRRGISIFKMEISKKLGKGAVKYAPAPA